MHFSSCRHEWFLKSCVPLRKVCCYFTKWSDESPEHPSNHTAITQNFVTVLKGAVCKFLTLLKHKNTIICLQVCKKHAKLTYLFILKTMLQSVIHLWKCASRDGTSVSVLVCVWSARVAQRISLQSWKLPRKVRSVVNLATCVWVKSEEEGPGKKTLQYFEFGLQYLVQPLVSTYSTFKHIF